MTRALRIGIDRQPQGLLNAFNTLKITEIFWILLCEPGIFGLLILFGQLQLDRPQARAC